MPHGVMSGNSRFTTMMPLVDGRTAEMHSKQPHEVIGSTIIEYALMRSTVPWLFSTMNWLIFSHWP